MNECGLLVVDLSDLLSGSVQLRLDVTLLSNHFVLRDYGRVELEDLLRLSY